MFFSDQWCQRATLRVFMCLCLKIGDLGDYAEPEYFCDGTEIETTPKK